MIRSLSLPLAVLTILAVGCLHREPITPSVTETGAPPARLLYLGDVQDVIGGIVNEDGRSWRDASVARIGFGAGSPESLESLGEFLSFNGVAYTKSTDPQSGDYFQVIHGPAFVSTCSVFIPHDAAPAFRVTYKAKGPDDSMSLGQLYEFLYEAGGGNAYCFSGTAHFSTLDALAISRAPIEGENIFEHRDKYYTEGASRESDVHTIIMGCATNFSNESDPERRELLARILYDNPYDEGGALSVHSHALLLHHPVGSLDDVGPDHVRDVNHLLSQSKIQGFDLEVFVMGDLTPHP